MKRNALALLVAAFVCLLLPAFSCERRVPVAPVAVGGSPSSGGSAPILLTGGAKQTGGASAAAGTSATDPGIADLVCPARVRTLLTVRFPLGGRMAPRSMRLLGFEPFASAPLYSRAWAALNPHCLAQVVGSCVGDGTIECLSTFPGTLFSTRANADAVYHQATIFDAFTGTWPPDDTGSDTESGWRAAVKLGLVKGYRMVASLVDIEAGLQSGPGDVGTMWSTEMFTPDETGTIHYNPAAIEGAHNWAIVAVDVKRRKIRGRQTWGDTFGCRSPDDGKPGYFSVGFDDMERLIADGAVAGFPIR
jgi:hypothetical protein